MLLYLKKHLAACIFKQDGNIRGMFLLQQVFKFLLCALEENPVTSVLHVKCRGVEHMEIADDHFSAGLQ